MPGMPSPQPDCLETCVKQSSLTIACCVACTSLEGFHLACMLKA